MSPNQSKTINSLSNRYKFKRSKQNIKNSFRYSFKFASIISPGSLKNMTLLSRQNSSNRVYIKQSYILLAWMSYIRDSKVKIAKTPDADSDLGQESHPCFFVFPCRTSKKTYLKAPMAHKTFSQEQFKTKFYSLSISFDNSFYKKSTTPGVNNSLFLALSMRNNNTPFESNLLFLKKMRMSITCNGPEYMSLV